MTDLGSVTYQGKKGVSRFVSANAAPASTPAVPPRPQGDLTRATIEEIAQAVRTTWPTKSADNRWRRSRGARDLLQHLSEFPGQTWQERWQASGFNQPGRPVSVLGSAPRDRSQIGTGAACLFCLRVIQPSLEAFRSNQFLYYGKRFLLAQNDPLLDEFWAQVQTNGSNTSRWSQPRLWPRSRTPAHNMKPSFRAGTIWVQGHTTLANRRGFGDRTRPSQGSQPSRNPRSTM